MKEMAQSSLMQVRGLKKTFVRADVSEDVLKGIDLEVREGEFVALVGPSGSGKSTLLHLMGLMDRPTEGEISFRGGRIDNAREASLDEFRRLNLGFIFQTFNLMGRLKAWENVSVSLLGIEPSAKQRKALAIEALNKVGMQNQIDKFPREMSGGQRQRVAIARAIVHNPKLILADEPTANLDRSHVAAVIDLLVTLQKNLKLTIVMASHDPEVYEKADRVLKLHGGKLL